MPLSDEQKPSFIDKREMSSEITLTCSTHGAVNMGVQFNGDWGRIFCADCFEQMLTDAGASLQVTFPGQASSATHAKK